MSTNDPRASIGTSRPSGNDPVTRFLGGSPLAVAGRLILLSVLVGFVMVAFGLDPYNIIHSIRRLIESIWNLGFDALRSVWRYFLLGAVIVIPVWLIMRLVNTPRGR
jgi:membrane-anchored glycerophosphoryl diester phosphodiesterase (GDPDase)